jgi:radical S-adenosyl methionine domain-containing protein 2
MIPSVNYHLWEPCNMRCKFCFATFQDVKQTILPKGHLPKEQAIEVVLQLAEIGFEKITFAGGEPTLCPWLAELITAAKEAGMTTMIVTNGSKLTDAFLEANKQTLDWIAISIDSLNTDTNISTGRAIAGNTPLTRDYYFALVDRIKQYGYGLKINTVVSSKNYTERMDEFIRYAQPKRWKLLQVLPIAGQNDLYIDNFKISDEQFKLFLDNHDDLKDITNIVPEFNSQMKGAYAMVDPAGRFYDNTMGRHNYSRPILEIGSRLAIQQVNYDFSKFVSRGGIYNWQIKKNVSDKNITISGEVASGKSTVGKALAAKLGYSFMSIGQKIRAVAVENGMDIVEFQKHCSENPQLDIDIDARFSEDCNKIKQVVLDYRLGFKFIQESFHVFLKIKKETAKSRLQSAGRYDETVETLEERNELFRKQFQTCYGIDYCDERHYDLVVNVEEFSSADDIANFIITQFNKQKNEN